MDPRKAADHLAAVFLGLAVLAAVSSCSSVPPTVNSVASAYLAACDSNPEATPSPTPYGTPVFGLLEYPNSPTKWPIWSIDGGGVSSGVGWYENTSGPGVVGNMVVASVTDTDAKKSYQSMMRLAAGDVVKITTCTSIFTYKVTVPPSTRTMGATDTRPFELDPDNPGAAPTVALLTMIAIPGFNPPVGTYYVGFAVLTGTTPR